MKVFDLILKALKWLKELFEVAKWVIALIALITSLGWVKSCQNKTEEIDNITDILSSRVETFKTKSGLNATEAKNWQVKYKSLNKINGEISQENNEINNELLKAKQTIKDLSLRLKDAKNYIKSDLNVKDSIKTEIVFVECDKIEIKPIKKKHISVSFKQTGNELDLIYNYNAEVSTVISRYPELKKNGKKHFPNWGWLYGWDYKTTSVINDPNASIDNMIEITFDK